MPSSKDYNKVLNVLHVLKDRDDPTLNYTNDLLQLYFTYYLLRNPGLFITYDLYRKYRDRHSDDLVNTDLYTDVFLLRMILDGLPRNNIIDQRLNQCNRQQMTAQVNRIKRDKYIVTDDKTNLKLEKFKYTVIPDLTSEHKSLLKSQVKRIHKLKQKTLQSLGDIKERSKKLKKTIKQQFRRINTNLKNRVKLETMKLRATNKPKYKIWHYTPQPNTRHSGMDGQKVLLDEKFIVTNERTGDTEYMDYPGDPAGTPSNTANCMCYISFSNK